MSIWPATRISIPLALLALLAPGATGAAWADTAEQIRAEIQSGLPAELAAVEVRVPAALAGASIGAGGPIAVTWRRGARPGWTTLRVQVGDRTGWVRTRIAAVVPAVVATRDLPAGHVVGESDVRIEMLPAAPGAESGAGATIPGPEGVVGRALRTPVASGAAVLPGALERAAPLPRGHQVTALVRRGRLSISAAGALERPAPIGQPTSVRLRGTGRVVHGRLLDSHTFLVEVSP